MNAQEEVVLERVHEGLVDQGTSSDDSRHLPVKEKTAILDLISRRVSDFFADCNMFVQALHKRFQVTVQLGKLKACHCDGPESRLPLSYFEVE